jgi:hypothetical protein
LALFRRQREKEPGANPLCWVIGVVSDLAADVVLLPMFFEYLHVDGNGLIGVGQGAHRFLQAKADVFAAVFPVGRRADRMLCSVGSEVIR